jgi:hypothetical protein
VVLNPTVAAMTVNVRQGFGSKNPVCKVRVDVPCWFQRDGRGPVLRVGVAATDPDPPIYRCASVASGIVCRSLKSGRGFKITDTHVVKLAPTKRS